MNYKLERVWGGGSKPNRSSMAKYLGNDSQCVGQDSNRASPEHRSRSITL